MGSEMCIRDRRLSVHLVVVAYPQHKVWRNINESVACIQHHMVMRCNAQMRRSVAWMQHDAFLGKVERLSVDANHSRIQKNTKTDITNPNFTFLHFPFFSLFGYTLRSSLFFRVLSTYPHNGRPIIFSLSS